MKNSNNRQGRSELGIYLTLSLEKIQINPKSNSLTIFFTAASGSGNKYAINYGTRPTADEYGFELTNSSNAVISANISALAQRTGYYIKIRAMNDCVPGDWSRILYSKTGQFLPTYKFTALPKIITRSLVQKIISTTPSKSIISPEVVAPANTYPITPAVSIPSDNTGVAGFFRTLGNFLKNLFN